MLSRWSVFIVAAVTTSPVLQVLGVVYAIVTTSPVIMGRMGLTPAERQRRSRERKQREWAALPPVPCACDCGLLIPPINKQGKPARWAHGHNPGGEATRFKPGQDLVPGSGPKTGARNPRWTGGQWTLTSGYVRVGLTEEEARRHPTAIKATKRRQWSIQRSHLVWNEHHPTDLVTSGEHVHHLNRIRDDDRIENLAKLTAADHLRHHNAIRAQRRGSAGRFIET